MKDLTLFCGTKNQTTYNLKEDLVLVDLDELDNDLLATFDLGGITLEYISTSKGLELESAYIYDGGYVFLPSVDFDKPILKNSVENLIMEKV